MKFGKNGRLDQDKSKYTENQPRGSFLERFKGRTIKVGREGHLGVVKNTSVPIKGVYDEPKQSYNNQQQYSLGLINQQNSDTTRNVKAKSNLEALSPLKRASSISEDNFESRADRYNSFARNYKRTQDPLSMSYNNKSALHKGLSNAGNNVLRNSYSNTMKDEYSKMGSSHSSNSPMTMNHSGLSFKSTPNAPNTSQNPGNAYYSMKVPAAMEASLKGSSQGLKIPMEKSSFYSAQNAPTGMGEFNSRHNLNASKKNITKAFPMPYSNSSASGNSDGFINTAVSTPLYKRARSNQNENNSPKQQPNQDVLSLLRVSMNRKNSPEDIIQHHTMKAQQM